MCTGISCPPNTLGNFFECFTLQHVLCQNYIPVIDLPIMLQTSRDLSLNNSVSGSLYMHNNQYTINSSLILWSIEVESKIPPSHQVTLSMSSCHLNTLEKTNHHLSRHNLNVPAYQFMRRRCKSSAIFYKYIHKYSHQRWGKQVVITFKHRWKSLNFFVCQINWSLAVVEEHILFKRATCNEVSSPQESEPYPQEFILFLLRNLNYCSWSPLGAHVELQHLQSTQSTCNCPVPWRGPQLQYKKY